MNWTTASRRKLIIFRPRSVTTTIPTMIQRGLRLLLAIITIVLLFLSQFFIMPMSKQDVVVDDVNSAAAVATPQSFVPNPVPASTLQPNKCPDHGVISVSDRGRLGNLMSQYATLYAYSKLLDRQPVISQHMSNTLLKVFPSASIPSSSICGKDYNWTISNVCDLMGFKGDRRSNVFIGDFPAELPIFNAYRKSLSLEFKMDLGLEMAAKMFLRTVSGNDSTVTFVGIHVRRMDYSVWLKNKVNGRLLSKLYFTQAMQYFREKYQNVAFVVASDDRQWITQMFKNMSDVHLTPRYQTMKRGEYDMAILAQCNHSIISFGTFSFWSAYLRPSGDVIVADGYYETQPLLLTYIKKTLSQWRLLPDPCYENSPPGLGKLKLSKQCSHSDKRLEYGIYDS